MGNTSLFGNVDPCPVPDQVLSYPTRIAQGVIETLRLFRIAGTILIIAISCSHISLSFIKSFSETKIGLFYFVNIPNETRTLTGSWKVGGESFPLFIHKPLYKLPFRLEEFINKNNSNSIRVNKLSSNEGH